MSRKPFTAEHRANLAAAKIGKSLSPEHIEHIRQSKLGRPRAPFTLEHRANITAALVRRHAKRKATLLDEYQIAVATVAEAS